MIANESSHPPVSAGDGSRMRRASDGHIHELSPLNLGADNPMLANLSKCLW